MNPISVIQSLMTTGARPVAAPTRPDEAAAIPASELRKLEGATNVVDGSFGSMLGRMVADVNGKQAAAQQAVQGLLSGQHVSLHQAVLSMEEASVAFQLMVEVRNKLLESYQELMRMQI